MPQLIAKKVFEDPTPEGIINQRFIQHAVYLTSITDLNDREKNQLLDILVLIGRKLSAVWNHLQNYVSIEDQLIKEARAKPIKASDQVILIDYSHDLFLEFDEYLTQQKSTLDYLVKVLIPILGKERWNLRTFGSKGRRVIKALQNNIPEKQNPGRKYLIYILEQNMAWLESMIETRDRINHFLDSSVDNLSFSIYCVIEDEKTQLNVPMWSEDQAIRELMKVSWKNLFLLCEGFVGGSIMLRLQSPNALLYMPSEMDTVVSPWKVTSKDDMERSIRTQGWQEL